MAQFLNAVSDVKISSLLFSLIRYSRDYMDHTYIITFFVTCFILPLGVIIVSYGKLMQKLRKVGSFVCLGHWNIFNSFI